MLNFTVGPVMSSEEILSIGADQVPYFRTPEFSQLMLENEAMMKEFTNSGMGSRAAFMTGSGTASMESVVVNFFDERDKVLVIDGGSFGHRFGQLCDLYNIENTKITPKSGHPLTKDALEPYEGKGYTGLLVNIHETSTGVYYDIDQISKFCQRNNIFLVVDAISSFLADPLDMTKHHIDVVITGSQKGLACPPGISVIVMAEKAVERLEEYPTRCMYLDIKNALSNGERGQTPFTPAVTILQQIHRRLTSIKENGGVETEIERTGKLAVYFREKIKEFPFTTYSKRQSNAVTSLETTACSAHELFLTLKDKYNIWICPNGGAMAESVFRVGHIGDLTTDDYDVLFDALYDLKKDGFFSEK